MIRPTGKLSDEVEAALRDAVAELGEDARDDAVLEHVDRALRRVADRYNTRPQPELGSLSPAQVHALLAADWRQPGGAIELRRDLVLDDVAHAPNFANARTLLSLVRERGSLPATTRHNLKVSTVGELLDMLVFEPDFVEDLRSVSKRITEEDVAPLNEVRLVCEYAGLLRCRDQRFTLTRSGVRLLDDAHAGELYALLFRSWFRELDIVYPSPEWPELQEQLAFTLYRLQSMAAGWRTDLQLMLDTVLPYALEQAPRARYASFDLSSMIFGSGVLDALVDFGLLERRPERSSTTLGVIEEYRNTPLAGRFLRFDL